MTESHLPSDAMALDDGHFSRATYQVEEDSSISTVEERGRGSENSKATGSELLR